MQMRLLSLPSTSVHMVSFDSSVGEPNSFWICAVSSSGVCPRSMVQLIGQASTRSPARGLPRARTSPATRPEVLRRTHVNEESVRAVWPAPAAPETVRCSTQDSPPVSSIESRQGGVRKASEEGSYSRRDSVVGGEGDTLGPRLGCAQGQVLVACTRRGVALAAYHGHMTGMAGLLLFGLLLLGVHASPRNINTSRRTYTRHINIRRDMLSICDLSSQNIPHSWHEPSLTSCSARPALQEIWT